MFVKKESDVNSEAKIIGGHHDDPYILESIAGNESFKNEIEDKNEKNMQSITLTRPLRRKLRISANSSLIRQKIGTFLI